MGRFSHQSPGDRSVELIHIEVSVDDILEDINKLNRKKSPGPDGIYLRVLKELKSEIADLLAKYTICH